MLWLGDEPPPKRNNSPSLFKTFVTHDLEEVPQLLQVASKIMEDKIASETVILPGTSDTIQSAPETHTSKGALWLRFEPLVLHVCCRDWEAAQALVAAARAAGLKNAAVSGPGPKLEHGLGARAFRVTVDGSERLEMPLAVAGTVAFPLHTAGPRKWLEEAVRRKFERNTVKTDRMLEMVTQGSLAAGICVNSVTPYGIAGHEATEALRAYPTQNTTALHL